MNSHGAGDQLGAAVDDAVHVDQKSFFHGKTFLISVRESGRRRLLAGAVLAGRCERIAAASAGGVQGSSGRGLVRAGAECEPQMIAAAKSGKVGRRGSYRATKRLTDVRERCRKACAARR